MRIVHLSDLHYGRVDYSIELALLDKVCSLEPDVVVVSGDLTQRARRSQFEDARRFLDSLPCPYLVVPGNHDIPAEKFWRRWLTPFHMYKQVVTDNLEPDFVSDTVAIKGLNTVNRFSWQQGKLSLKSAVKAGLWASGQQANTKILTIHHPLEKIQNSNKNAMRGSRAVLKALEKEGFDIVLSGHVHKGVIKPFAQNPKLLMVQVGTSLSNRLRKEANMFYVLEIEQERCHITDCTLKKNGELSFVEKATYDYLKTPNGWEKQP